MRMHELRRKSLRFMIHLRKFDRPGFGEEIRDVPLTDFRLPTTDLLNDLRND